MPIEKMSSTGFLRINNTNLNFQQFVFFCPSANESIKSHNLVNWLNNKMYQIANDLITLNNSERVLSTLINTIPNPAFFRNPDGVFVDCNKAFADMILGTGCENVVGQSIYELPDIIPQALSDI